MGILINLIIKKICYFNYFTFYTINQYIYVPTENFSCRILCVYTDLNLNFKINIIFRKTIF